MGHVGGEHFDRLDPVIERVRHVAQRAGEMSDLVAPAGEIGALDPRTDAATDALGAVGKPAHRTRNRARQQSDSTIMTAEATPPTLRMASRSAVTIWSMSSPWVESISEPWMARKR